MPGTPALTPASQAAIRGLLPAPAPTGRPRRAVAEVLAGILRVLHTGAPGREIPARHGPWRTGHDWYARWQRDGTWTCVYAALARHDQLTE